MRASFLLALILPLCSAAPTPFDMKHKHGGNDIRNQKVFDYSQINMGDLAVDSATGDNMQIGHTLDVNVVQSDEVNSVKENHDSQGNAQATAHSQDRENPGQVEEDVSIRSQVDIDVETPTDSTACTGYPPSTSDGSWTCNDDLTSCQLICTTGYTPIMHNIACVNSQWDTTSNHICAPTSNQVYLLAGGLDARLNVELYHPTLGSPSCKSPPPQLPEGRLGHTSFFHDSSIYVCGGRKTESTCLSLEPSTASSWTTHALPVGEGLSSVVLVDKVVFLGGYDSNYISSTYTNLPLSSNPTLTTVPNLSYKGQGQCVAKLSETSFIISGGYNGQDDYYNKDNYFSTVLLYNLETESVITLSPLSSPRTYHGCITVEQEGKLWLIVTGGVDETGALATTQRLDIEANTWEDLGDLKQARYGHTMINSENRGMMVLEGIDSNFGGKRLNSAEVLMKKEWQRIEPSLVTGRSYFGGAVEVSADLFSCLLDLKPGLVCGAGEVNSDACFCKSSNEDKSGEVCSSNQSCTEEGVCYDVCTPGPYILKEDCFCNKTKGRGKLCNEGFKCDGGECVSIDIKDDNKFDNNEVISAKKCSNECNEEMYKWENNVVPYYYNNEYATDGDKYLMRSVMDRIQEKTCFKFEEKTQDEYEDKHSLEIYIRDVKCTGRVTGSISSIPNSKILKLSLSGHITNDNGDDCGYKGLVTHELMHVLGVAHTHQRSDRDDFIIVKQEFLDNASEGIRNQFEKCAPCKLHESLPYDCGSIMHSGTHFKGQEIIVPKGTCNLSKRAKMFFVPDATAKDYELLNIIGNCPVPVDCQWSDWSSCSTSCGGGRRQRERKNSGNTCIEDKVDTEPCNLWPCPGRWQNKVHCRDVGVENRHCTYVVPYYYSETAFSIGHIENGVNPKDKKLIREIMNRIEEKTCFAFQEKRGEEDSDENCLAIFIEESLCSDGISGFVSSVPYSNKLQLFLSGHITDEDGDDCGSQGLVTHHLMKVLGMIETHRRRDRDDFITVRVDNLHDADAASTELYQKCDECKLHESVKYDCSSIMHYGTHFDGKEVIVPNDEKTCKLESIHNLVFQQDATANDYDLLNIIADCAALPVIDGAWTDWTECSRTCQGGVQTRTCTNPSPHNGGKKCTGDNSQPCNVDVKCMASVCEIKDDEPLTADCFCINGGEGILCRKQVYPYYSVCSKYGCEMRKFPSFYIPWPFLG